MPRWLYAVMLGGFVLLGSFSAPAAPNATSTNGTSGVGTPPGSAVPGHVATKIPLDIQSTGMDAAGAALGFKLKETVLTSQFFILTTDSRRFILRLATRPEFPDRPDLSSIYAAALYFQESPDVLPYFLDLRVGLVDGASVAAQTQSLLDWSSNITKKFNYLLRE